MRRTVLGTLALACAAVLAGPATALADDATPSPVPTAVPSAVPTAAPAEPTRDAGTAPSPVASVPGERTRDQVSVVPRGAADTGVPEASSPAGYADDLIGGGAAALVVGGATVLVVRRRRATGA
ncbi:MULTISPECIES: Tat pathway signal sequence domain protein [unclassified Streptomyces]|uniref:Tat pathway signal sequence domain protein n=1 Tax=unclassified Streptomyces TaxID=2593676 RepID=UPI001F04124D|nr:MULTISPECIES: Tat pathway signal sequence domain protein [unclassified Streptomyces]MCH0566979.1 Tat pathway signal sequence domain protein [Streptomyces sp. MUM 2J]MCH0572577.1 Tat pathway signal sequence domain protein [Streptomyces sp. MUM 136J]